MKNIIALFSLLLFFPATAQEYVPMLEVGKIWNMEWHSDFGTFIPYTIEITETVQINNIIYYKLVQSPVYNCSILLREKISEKKIYRLINNEDVLMFDFSLEAGDYAPDNFPRSPYASSSYINEVGYDDFFGISNLKYFDIDWQILVESIGFFYRGGIIPCYDEVCQAFPIYEHDILVGMNNNLFVNDNFIKVDLLYHSNTKQLQIINSNEIFQINIFSMLGVKVLDKEFSKKLDVSKLKQGVYIYSLTKNNSVKTGKILVY